MKKSILFALAVSTASMASAQVTNTSNAGSNADASSGSISGAASDVSNAANNNIGNSAAGANSNSDARSGSISGSASYGNQTEQQQGQGQGQSQSNTMNVSLTTPQTSQGSQGSAQAAGTSMATVLTFEGTKKTEVRTNTAVPLAASSSFSSDYCGGTMSGGVSAAPIGISIGGSSPKFDKSCQALRRAEKFGMAAANAHNLGQADLANRLMTMMIWSICTADSSGPSEHQPTAQACASAGLLGSGSLMAANAPVPPQPQPHTARQPQVTMGGQITPQSAASQATGGPDERLPAALPR